VSHSCLSFPTGRQFKNLGAPPCEVWARKMIKCPLWVIGDCAATLGITSGVPQKADDLLQRPSRQPRVRFGRCGYVRGTAAVPQKADDFVAARKSSALGHKRSFGACQRPDDNSSRQVLYVDGFS
jgi:hypothetical protein